MLEMKVQLTLLEELLGTCAGDPEIYQEYIASKAPRATDDEIETLPPEDELRNETTVFHRDADGAPFIFDYQIKGFFKDACGMLRRADDGESQKLKAFKKEIDGLIFVEPRRILLVMPPDGTIGICERPLRAQTAKGERICLTRSETVPVGTILSFTISALRDNLEGAIVEWLSYGKFRGLGQWRNSGKGRFAWHRL